MKIGIYGDSYAEKGAPAHSWWRLLQVDHGHQVTSYGESGSSIMFSVNMLLKWHHEYDLNILCLTCPGRFSVSLGSGQWFHSTAYMTSDGRLHQSPPAHHGEILDACYKHIKYLSDPATENFVGKSIVMCLQHTIQNLMVIPCFKPPLDSEFNLFDLCTQELQAIFPGQETWDIYQKYNDIRACHLTSKNNSILAEMINRDTRPRLFTADYDDFCFENIQISDILTAKN